MRRTQLLLPSDLHDRAAAHARTRGLSLGGLVREALADYLGKAGTGAPGSDDVETVLLADPFDDPHPDPQLSLDADHHLYGARRRSSRKR
jgi:hypothetical protein